MSKAKILIIDDSLMIRSMLTEYIQTKNAQFLFAGDGHSAIQMVKDEKPDIILLDIVLPDISGFEICKTVKQNEWGKNIPIIFITSLDDDATLMKCFEAGGVDFIHKPFRAVEVNARIQTHLELSRMHAELRKSTRTDFLTKLFNRAHIIECIQTEISRSKRAKSTFSLIIGDIDKFKSINDSYGHSAGDYALKAIAAIMQGTSRKSDIVARWGGEEFMILLPDADKEQAFCFAENMRKRVASFKYLYDDKQFACTITFGVKEYDYSKSIEQNINDADEALYQGKMSGRNRVVIAGND